MDKKVNEQKEELKSKEELRKELREKFKKEKMDVAGQRKKVKLKSEKVRRREKNIKILRICLLITTLFLIIIYFLLKIIYETGAFTISLDPELEMNGRNCHV